MSLSWILLLTVPLLHCLTALPINQIKLLIEELQKSNCSEADSTFYSPSGYNNCVIEALDCSVQELDKVRTECFPPNNRQAQLINRTKDTIDHILTTLRSITLPAKPENCFCGEGNVEEKPYKEFLGNILRLFQKLNSS